MQLARSYQCSPTELLSSNVDDFITVLNYFTIKEDKEIEKKLAKYGAESMQRDNILAFL